MKVTGYQLREALRRWTTKQQISAKIFPETMFSFDVKPSVTPREVADDFWDASVAVAKIQVAQQKFNFAVSVTVDGNTMSLAEAIKLLSFAGQASKMWRTAAADNGRDRYSARELKRSKDDEIARRVVSVQECMKASEDRDRFNSLLRSAVAKANGTEVEIDINEGYFS